MKEELLQEIEMWLLNHNVQNVRKIREAELQHLLSLLDKEEESNG